MKCREKYKHSSVGSFNAGANSLADLSNLWSLIIQEHTNVEPEPSAKTGEMG